jgi:hypothetical protein
MEFGKKYYDPGNQSADNDPFYLSTKSYLSGSFFN